jgi:hypothetical protein
MEYRININSIGFDSKQDYVGKFLDEGFANKLSVGNRE